ncbi:MAG: M23 family metallopeptidase [Pseudobdellovibrionaceae bacterium]
MAGVLNFAFAFAFAILLPQTLLAGTPPLFLWSDSKAFVAADASCRLRQEEQVPFFISQKPHSQLDSFSKLKGLGFFGGMFSHKLLDRSLITAKDAATAERTEPSEETVQIRVLSIPRNAPHPDVSQISEAGDEGTLAKESLQDIGNFVIEVLDAPAILNSASLKAPFKVQKSFWQAALENEKFLSLTCGEVTHPVRYILFDVYNLNNMNPIAQVGLQVEETHILDSINVFTPEEANQAVKDENNSPREEPPAPGEGGKGDSPPFRPPVEVPLPDPLPPPAEDQNGIPVLEGDLEYVLCSEDKTTDVLAKDLKTKVFSASRFETVIPSQSWDEKRKTSYLEVRFPDRENGPNSGWLPRSLVQLRNECAPLKKIAPSEEDRVVDDSLATLDPHVSRKDCCKFPTMRRSSQAYTSGMLQFRARRNNGRRRHAGCDLYRTRGEPAVAVASGTVLRGLYYFYQGVFALEIKHPKFIARYGEVLGKYPNGVARGKNVVAGQEVGYIGRVNSGCCTPMLHFELFKGSSHGSLTRHRVPPFDRRSDVMDPTGLLRQWEKTQFGKSY